MRFSVIFCVHFECSEFLNPKLFVKWRKIRFFPVRLIRVWYHGCTKWMQQRINKVSEVNAWTYDLTERYFSGTVLHSTHFCRRYTMNLTPSPPPSIDYLLKFTVLQSTNYFTWCAIHSWRKYQRRVDKNTGRSTCNYESKIGVCKRNVQKTTGKCFSVVFSSIEKQKLFFGCPTKGDPPQFPSPFICSNLDFLLFPLPHSVNLRTTNWRYRTQDISRVIHYKNMSQEALWLDCAEKLTAMIQNIIEFAKLIPGFMRLSQDDQVNIFRSNIKFILYLCPVSFIKRILSSFRAIRFYCWKLVHLNWQSFECPD